MARSKHPQRRKKKQGIKTTPKVLALFGGAKRDPGACAIIRITMPFAQARKKRLNVVLDHMTHSDAWAAGKSGYPLGKYDLYVLPRIGDMEGEALKLVSSLQAAGKTVVWETDDDYTNEYRDVIFADATAIAEKVDAITVSTPYLGDRYKKYNRNIHVLPNCIDLDMWSPYANMRRIRKGITIGIGGTATHYHDWQVVLEPMRKILKEFPKTTFVVMGYKPDYFDTLPDSRVDYIPPLPYMNYPGAVRQLDIGLAPLLPDDKFNLSKSAIKALEYWSSMRECGGQWGGVAVVATDMPVYNRVVRNGTTGLLVEHTEQAWHSAIRSLVKSQQLRNDLGVAGLKHVRRHRLISQRAGEWITAYRRIHADAQQL